MRRIHRSKRGFTLIELLIVIAILGVLAAIVVPNVIGFIGSGESQGAQTEYDTIQTAVDSMMVDQGLSTLPNPVTTATSDMSGFPDPAYPIYPTYLRDATATGTYTCAADGTVTQASTGY